uniref:relA-associated inhibitor-like n=1 Tax=Oncorhynchus gorbuscha TaxID=8017 RepID=UPI001EAF83AA|nr:relA-associated inhibitor-like [Oncorhynchus gorbuscha]
MNKLFRRKGLTGQQGGEMGSDYSSSSDGEGDSSTSLSPVTNPVPNTGPNTGPALTEYRGYNSILRRASRERGDSGQRARLSPLVLLLDGSLVGELDTVQRAVQEMNDPSQPNDEGITALHNAICGGHYSVVDFLVRIGANVSAPDSHGWTPLHCAASCNDLPLCQFLVRNGAAVMAVTESDDATASQKCDPYAMGFEECESFLRGVEEAMGVENSGVLYALWEYPAQEADELGFREGDMVTILQKPDGIDWWWASLCGREGFIPNNYFGLFPKVRPKSLC